MADPYDELDDQSISIDIKRRGDLKQVYFSFLGDFKKYLVEYVRESSIDLAISQIEVSSIPSNIFAGECEGFYVTLKNQGGISCFLTTDKKGGYRLDPGEKEKFWLNNETLVLTLSGTTTVGFIRS